MMIFGSNEEYQQISVKHRHIRRLRADLAICMESLRLGIHIEAQSLCLGVSWTHLRCASPFSTP